ncbi:MAG TPA: MerR family transcriptional regulator [Acidimicrobiia bacterium]|nr:MerR family transcriptional regulator [Acidimicrobiia bacterium]
MPGRLGKDGQRFSQGEQVQRSGLATSALRFYEAKGLIRSERTQGNQRRYPRATLWWMAILRAVREAGLSLEEVAAELGTGPRYLLGDSAADLPTRAG